MSYSGVRNKSKGLVYMIYQKKEDAGVGVGVKIHEIPKEGNLCRICLHVGDLQTQ